VAGEMGQSRAGLPRALPRRAIRPIQPIQSPQSPQSSQSNQPSQSNQRTVRLPFGRSAVPVARREVVDDLAARRLPQQVIDEAESVVAELVGNAVRHASSLPDGTVRLHWFVRDGVVEIEVTDGGGGTRPAPLRPADFAVSGRGLRIVRSLAHEWGVLDASPHRPGHTVWASVGGPSRRRTF
jgi:serine/threonine-protein kinase RsbW